MENIFLRLGSAGKTTKAMLNEGHMIMTLVEPNFLAQLLGNFGISLKTNTSPIFHRVQYNQQY